MVKTVWEEGSSVDDDTGKGKKPIELGDVSLELHGRYNRRLTHRDITNDGVVF